MGLFTSTFTHTHTTKLLPPQPSISEPSPSGPVSLPDTNLAKPHQIALSLLHDPTAIITLNPLVTDVEEVDPSTVDIDTLLPSCNSSNLELPDPAKISDAARRCFRVTESKSLIFGYYVAKIECHLSYLALDEGCDTVVSAPRGVRVEGIWRVEIESSDAGEAQGLRLFESATVVCPTIFAMFIRGSSGSTHKVMHAQFVERWKARLSSQTKGAH